MKKQLEPFAIGFCEQLPFGGTILKKDNYCQQAPNDCKYCSKETEKKYLCSKKTYTPLFELVQNFNQRSFKVTFSN